MKTTAPNHPLPMFHPRTARHKAAIEAQFNALHAQASVTLFTQRSRREKLHAFLRSAFFILLGLSCAGGALMPVAACVGDKDGFLIFCAVIVSASFAAILAGVATHVTGRKAK